MEYGYIKVASAVPLVSVANCNENVKNIENLRGGGDETS